MVLALLGAACGGGGGDGQVVDTTGASTTTNRPTATGPTPTSAPTSDTTGIAAAPADGGTGSALTPSPTTAPAAPDDHEVAAPAAGRYHYRAEGSMDGREVSVSEVQQVEVLDGGLIRVTGPGGEQIATLRLDSEAVRLVSLTISGGGGAFIRRFEPPEPVMFQPRALDPGRRWSWSMTDSGATTTVHEEASFVGVEPVDTPTGTIDALLIESTLTFSGDVHGEVRLRSWIDRDIGMPVRYEDHRDLRYGLFTSQRDTTSIITSIDR